MKVLSLQNFQNFINFNQNINRWLQIHYSHNGFDETHLHIRSINLLIEIIIKDGLGFEKTLGLILILFNFFS